MNKIQSKEDVDLYLDKLKKKSKRCNHKEYRDILSTLPEMSRVRLYFVRRTKEHNLEILKAIEEKKEADKMKKEKKRLEKEIEKRQLIKLQKEEREKKIKEKRALEKRKNGSIISTNPSESEDSAVQKRNIRNLEILKYKMIQSRKVLEIEGFDNFNYIQNLRSLFLESREELSLEKCLQNKEPTDFWSTTVKDNLVRHFHHFYYQNTNTYQLTQAIEKVTDDILRNELMIIMGQMADFERAEAIDLLERLSMLGKEDVASRYYGYHLFWWDERKRFILNHVLNAPERIIDDAAIIISAYMNNDKDENIKSFKDMTDLLRNIIGKDYSLSLYNRCANLCEIAAYDFPKTYDDMQKACKSTDCKKISLEDGIIHVPWKYVIFGEKKLFIHHPSHFNKPNYPPKVFKTSTAKVAFNNVSNMLKRRLPPIVVYAEEGQIKAVVDIPSIKECLSILNQRTTIPNFDILDNELSPYTGGISKSQLRRIITEKDPRYIEFLCDNQLNNCGVFYILEVKINSSRIETEEEGFLFVVKKGKTFDTLVFENTLPDRSTIIFKVKKGQQSIAIRFIYECLASDIINKRELLLHHRVDTNSHGIISYHHIYHTTFQEWKNNILNFIS